MTDTKLDIVQKLAKIREMVEVLRKNKAGHNYRYVTEDEIMARVAAGMKKYDVSLIPSIVPNTITVSPYQYEKVKTLKNGDVIKEIVNQVMIHGEMLFTWVNNEDREDIVQVPWALVGQQSDASQALGSALTYANRYFMLKYFQIATPDDDPDNWRSKKAEAEHESEMVITRQIIAQIDTHIRSYLDAIIDEETKGKARKLLGATIKKYVRNGNKDSVDYANNLKDPEIAGKLLKTLQTEFPVADTNEGDTE